MKTRLIELFRTGIGKGSFCLEETEEEKGGGGRKEEAKLAKLVSASKAAPPMQSREEKSVARADLTFRRICREPRLSVARLGLAPLAAIV